MSLDHLIATIRSADGAGEGDDPGLAAETRLRVMRSIETRARGRHQLVGIATTIAILLAGTVSWALATGQVATLWAPSPVPQVIPEVAPPALPPPPRPPRHRRASVVPPAEVPGPAAAVEDPPIDPPLDPPVDPPLDPPLDLTSSIDPRPLPPEVAPPEAPPPAAVPSPVPPVRRLPAPPVRRLAPPEPPVEVLYRRAHELHFHGGDPAAALAAWDRYLAAEPDGRFAVEARYNRALVLVRLGRYAEARGALLPFAHGEIDPPGYRQVEAEQLVERLAQYQ